MNLQARPVPARTPLIRHWFCGLLILGSVSAMTTIRAQEGVATRTDAYVAQVQVESQRVVNAYLTAINTGDFDAIDKLVDPNMIVTANWGECRHKDHGASCFLHLSQREISSHARLELQMLRVERDIVRAKLSIASAETDAKYGRPVIVTDEFLVSGDKIVSFVRTPHTEDPITRKYFTTLRSQ
jgi:hypothetical protein